MILSAVGALTDQISGLAPEVGTGVATLALFGLFYKYQRSFVNDCGKQLKDLRKENRLCNWRLGLLLRAARQQGVDVPDELWNPAHLEEDDGADVG